MRIFKVEIVKRILSFISLIAMIICMDWGIGEILEPVTYATYFNHDISEIEDAEMNVDVVFIGASRVFATFVPKVFEDDCNVQCVINAGSASQPLSATYYQLKDLIERVHPSKVYIGVVTNQLAQNMKTATQGKLIVYDRLSMKNKILMGLNCFGIKEKKYLLDTYRFKDKFNKEDIVSKIQTMNGLRESDYYSFSEKDDYYADKGFVYSYKSYVTGTIPIMGMSKFSEERIVDENLRYLDKCIELCEKNNIEVNLVTGVTSVMRMYVNEGYQDAVDFYKKYASEKGIRYYNLNYLKKREELIPDELMQDHNHTNGEGAYVASKLFAEVIKKEEAGEDISSYFYSNLDEFKKDVNRVVAVKATFTEDEERENVFFVKIQSLQNDDIIPYYRVLIKYSGDDEYKTIVDWTNSSEVELEVMEEAGYEIKVEAGVTPGQGIAYQEYEY